MQDQVFIVYVCPVACTKAIMSSSIDHDRERGKRVGNFNNKRPGM